MDTEPLFVSTSEHKRAEMAELFALADPDLPEAPEVQAATLETIAKAKAKNAFYAVNMANVRKQGWVRWLFSTTPLYPVVVEDSSLELDAWGGAPGAYIKWTLDAHGAAGLWALVEPTGNYTATARSAVVYYYKAWGEERIQCCTHTVQGRLCLHGAKALATTASFSRTGAPRRLQRWVPSASATRHAGLRPVAS